MEEENVEQSCFDLLIACFVSGIINDEEFEPDEMNRAYMVDEVMAVLGDHLDEEGIEMMQTAFEKLQFQYDVQLKAEEIISGLDWKKDLDSSSDDVE